MNEIVAHTLHGQILLNPCHRVRFTTDEGQVFDVKINNDRITVRKTADYGDRLAIFPVAANVVEIR